MMIDSNTFEQLRNQYQQGCVFCSPSPDLVLARTANFGVCFDVAPLTPGHLILHSDEHFGCAGEVPQDNFEELLALKQTVARILADTYGAVTFYEHGRAGHCLTDGPEHRLCHHYHLHCVPIDVDLTSQLSARFDAIEVAGYDQMPELYEQFGDYLYIEAWSGKGTYFPVDKPIERHLLRTLISEAIGHPNRADWKSYESSAPLSQGIHELPSAAFQAAIRANGIAAQ